MDGAGEGADENYRHTGGPEGDAGDEKYVRGGGEYLQEVAHAVVPCLERWGAVAAVGDEGYGDFGEAEFAAECGYEHLGGEFHAWGAQGEGWEEAAVEATEAGVAVGDVVSAAVEGVDEQVENGGAEVAVQEGHAPFGDAAAVAGADDEIVALLEAGDEGGGLGEVVGVVGVGEDDDVVFGGLESVEQVGSVAFFFARCYPGPVGAGYFD